MGKQTQTRTQVKTAAEPAAASAFSAWLRRQREGMGLSPAELARRLDPAAPPVESFEAGAVRPSRAQAETLADLFSVPPDQRTAFVLFATTDLDTDDDAPPDAPWVVRVRPPSNLPLQLTSFVGREGEVDRVASMLARPDVRLLTLLGPPGIGKTRLSLEVAHMLLDAAPGEEDTARRHSYEDGIFFVPLASVTDYALVPSAVATTLNLKLTANQPPMDALRDFLDGKDMLLVLDNFEQIVGAGTAVADLLSVCPNVQVMVSSRVALHVYGEQVYRVPPMLLPGKEVKVTPESLAEWEAVDLFLQRVRLVRHDFTLDEQTAPVVAEIVRRLDGLPLAIELAAARARVLTPRGILERLDDRLKLLVGGADNVPARQRTLRGAIDWSYDLLDETEARLFRRLSVFVGGCSLSAAERMAEDDDPSGARAGRDALDLIASLVDKSLLKEESGPGGENRLLMLETLREYGLERLRAAGEEAEMRRRHALLMTDLAEAAEPHLTSAARDPWMARLDADLDNIRAALSWSLSDVGDAGVGLRLAGALGWYWEHKGHFAEGWRWLHDVIASVDDTDRSSVRGRALYALGMLAEERGDIDTARNALEESVGIFSVSGETRLYAYSLLVLCRVTANLSDLSTREMAAQAVDTLRALDDKWGLAHGLEVVASMDYVLGDMASARARDLESLALYKELGDKWYTAYMLRELGVHALNVGDLAQACAHLDEAVALSQEIGFHFNLGLALFAYGLVHYTTGEYALAEGSFQQAVALFEALGDRGRVGVLTRHVAYVACRRNRLDRALALLKEAAAIIQGTGRTWHIALTVMATGSVAAALGDWRLAARALGATLAVFEDGVNETNAVADDIAEYIDLYNGAKAKLSSEEFARLSAEEPVSLDHALTEVLALVTASRTVSSNRQDAKLDANLGSYPAGLSKREVELLRLVALGLTNFEVAARLFLSPNTVRAHLYSIYNKIDVTSRTAAAHFAVEHGLA
ncbi:MAG TPA: tetratricopeptide repeat protein [Chloroflexia bacterium]|nr:tetratricopeptide repeat protein [Chloroflexia bacterium]